MHPFTTATPVQEGWVFLASVRSSFILTNEPPPLCKREVTLLPACKLMCWTLTCDSKCQWRANEVITQTVGGPSLTCMLPPPPRCCTRNKERNQYLHLFFIKSMQGCRYSLRICFMNISGINKKDAAVFWLCIEVKNRVTNIKMPLSCSASCRLGPEWPVVWQAVRYLTVITTAVVSQCANQEELALRRPGSLSAPSWWAALDSTCHLNVYIGNA